MMRKRRNRKKDGSFYSKIGKIGKLQPLQALVCYVPGIHKLSQTNSWSILITKANIFAQEHVLALGSAQQELMIKMI